MERPARRSPGSSTRRGAVVLAAAALVLIPAIPAGAIAADGVGPAPAMSPLQVGTRLTWEVGDATTEGYQLVADPNGWFERDGRHYTLKTIGGRAGFGLHQIDIVEAGPDGTVGDLRILANSTPGTNEHMTFDAARVVADAEGMGIYWMPPARLAAMEETRDGPVQVFRTTRDLAGQAVEFLGITTRVPDHYETRLYDMASGLLSIAASMTVITPGVRLLDENDDLLDEGRGAVTYTTKAFLGQRAFLLPWSGTPMPEWAVTGRSLQFQGQIGNQSYLMSGLPGMPYSVNHGFDQRLGGVVMGRQTARWPSMVAGQSDNEDVKERVYAVGTIDGLWIPPDTLAQLRPGQVLDQDPHNGYTLTFEGIVQGLATLVLSGTAERWTGGYDPVSGVLTWSLRSQRVDAGGGDAQLYELSLVGP